MCFVGQAAAPEKDELHDFMNLSELQQTFGFGGVGGNGADPDEQVRVG